MQRVLSLYLLLVSACIGAVDDDPELGVTAEALTDTESPPGCESAPCSACGASPLLLNLDLSSDFIQTVDPAHGVLFDIDHDGTRPRIGWTAAGVFDGFLALDRNGNGKIDDGHELFGTSSPQFLPLGTKPNGFRSLSAYDSNGDGWITSADDVWSHLLVWIDRNHDGVSASFADHGLYTQEVWSLQDWFVYDPPSAQGQVGVPYKRYTITGIDLHYSNSYNFVSNGNNFWFHSSVLWSYTGYARNPTTGQLYAISGVRYDNVEDVYFAKDPTMPATSCSSGICYSVFTLPMCPAVPATVPSIIFDVINPLKIVPAYGCKRSVFLRPRDPTNALQQTYCSGGLDPQTNLPPERDPVNPMTYAHSPTNPNIHAFQIWNMVRATQRIDTIEYFVSFILQANPWFQRNRVTDRVYNYFYVGLHDATKPTLSQFCYFVDPANFNHYYIPPGGGPSLNPPSYAYHDYDCDAAMGADKDDAIRILDQKLDQIPVIWADN